MFVGLPPTFGGTTEPGNTVTEPKESVPEIRVCIREDPPFFFQPEGDGEWAGFEFDLLTEFATLERVRLRFIDPGSFRAVLDSIAGGECEMGVSRITRTEERELQFDFSPSYFPVRVLAVEREGAVTIRPEQLRGKKAVTIPGSTYPAVIDAIGDIEKIWVETTREMFRAVLEDRADFMACDSAVVLALMKDYPGTQITVPLSDRKHFAVALTKGSKWTEPLARFMERFRSSGDLRRLLVSYFGEKGADLILSDS